MPVDPLPLRLLLLPVVLLFCLLLLLLDLPTPGCLLSLLRLRRALPLQTLLLHLWVYCFASEVAVHGQPRGWQESRCSQE